LRKVPAQKGHIIKSKKHWEEKKKPAAILPKGKTGLAAVVFRMDREVYEKRKHTENGNQVDRETPDGKPLGTRGKKVLKKTRRRKQKTPT